MKMNAMIRSADPHASHPERARGLGNGRSLRHSFAPQVLVLLMLATIAAHGATFIVQMANTRFVPANLTISVGDTVTWTNRDFTFHDTVSGTNGLPSGVWASPLFGRGGRFSFTFTNVPPGGYGYYCTPHVFVGMVGSITVLPANILPSVAITNPPDGGVVAAGLPLLLQADATDSDGTVSRVDFLANGGFIGSDSTAPFAATLTNVAPGDLTLTAMAVDNRGGATTSAVVRVTAIEPPRIDVQPGDLVRNEGESATFSVIASGAELNYQWQFNGGNITGATNSALTISPVTAANEGEYLVVVSNRAATATSRPASLSVTPLPVVVLTSPAEGARFPLGASVTVTADATNAGGLSVRVEFLTNSIIAEIVTNPPFSIILSNLSAGRYEIAARAINDRGGRSTSESVRVSVHDPPVVQLTQPAPGVELPAGAAILLTASAAGTGTTVTNVSFFANGLPVGDDTAKPFEAAWLPVATGSNTLGAEATDDLGQSGISAPVRVRIYEPENVLPTIAITSSPPNFARTNSPWVRLAGTAGDNQFVLRVEVQINEGPYVAVSGTDRWLAESFRLVPGPNTVRVRSVDQANNVSPPAIRYFTYVVNTPLTVEVRGLGSVTPDLNNMPLEIGKVYSLTARPARGWLYSDWNGSYGQGPVLSFLMREQLTNVVTFVRNPFPAVAGNYAGLVLDTNAPAPASSGLLSLKLRDSGAFSGKLALGGARHSLSGQFNPAGETRVTLLRAGWTPVVLRLTNDLASGAGTITGTATDGIWLAGVTAYRNTFHAKTNSAPQTGTRRFALLLADGSPVEVATGAAKIAPGGTVKLSGVLQMRRNYSLSTSLAPTDYGDCPFYASFGGGSEVLAGWLRLAPPPLPAVGGEIYWLVGGVGARTNLLQAVPLP